MSDAAVRELRSWGDGLVTISRESPDRCSLILRLLGMNGALRKTSVSLHFDQQSNWTIDNITRADVERHQVVLHHDGQQTRIARLLLPAGLERALHVGEVSTVALDLPTVASPFDHKGKPPRVRPRDVIVWTEFAARSRLGMWWACASFPRARIWLVTLPLDRANQEESFGHRLASELMEAAPRIRRLTSKQAARFASNWKAWERGDADFQAVSLPGWVGEVPQPIFDLFPRVDRLAPYDQQLLTLLGTEWSSTIETVMRLLRGADSRLMYVWGDMTLHRRLHTWSRWKRGRYVESRPSKTEKSFSGLQYRLTEEGQRLLFRLPSLDCAPPRTFGGFRFYVPGSWVMTPKGPRRAQ